MKIHVELCSSLRRLYPRYDPTKSLPLELPAGSRVSDALGALGITAGEAGVIMINRNCSVTGSLLADGDTLGLFSAVAGG
jgi:sulfur carrier protein ThiS